MKQHHPFRFYTLVSLLFASTATASISQWFPLFDTAAEIEPDGTTTTAPKKEDALTGMLLEREKRKTSYQKPPSQQPRHHHEQCGIWLAPSTIPGAGLGMFAGVDFSTGETLLEDSVVAIVDMLQHNYGDTIYAHFLWDEYTWNAKSLKMDREGYTEVNVASPGFGAAANCNLPIFNVEEYQPLLVNFSPSLHRARDPGAGAFSSFHYRKSTAKRPIAAGEEFFVSYGSEWFETRPQLGPVPLHDDLDSASTLLEKYGSLQSTLNRTTKNADAAETILSDIWNTFVEHTSFNDSRVLKGALASSSNDDSNKTHSTLHVLQQHYQNNVTAATIDKSSRSVEWLQQHGTCGDHMVAKPSRLLPQAGMGAFATRPLPAGTIVAQLPMIHVTNRSRFDMYQLVPDEETGNMIPNTTAGVIGQQLLLNYCYGHGESTLLLCPYGPMVNYVNHNQSAANVRLQWGRSDTGNHMPELLLNSTVRDLAESDATAKLAMEFVAIRDIGVDEEILLDYGDEWETAWNRHVSQWIPVPNADTYVSASQLNAANQELRTVFEEIEEATYPANVELRCDTSFHLHPDEWEEAYELGQLEEYLFHNEESWWPCDILRYRRVKDTISGDEILLYTVHMYEEDEEKKETNNVLVEDIPRAAFHFVDLPYTADAHQPNAFRHDIRIPDEIFPKSWRNLRESVQADGEDEV